MKLTALFFTGSILLLMSPCIKWCGSSTPSPSPWPKQFHALLYMNMSGRFLKLSDFWYDWPKGRGVNIFQRQLGGILYDIEWDNGTTFYYTLDSNRYCRVMESEVGILRPDFLDGANYLGTQLTDGFLCHVWEKIDFIWYYEDVISRRPVRWDFYDGISSHVMTFEVGAVLPDFVTQAPEHCFNQESHRDTLELENHPPLYRLSPH
ncbi:hypothetical protein L6164_014096 [Bauhinia variegata]|uniref:Uncharacterized protein n=1 Tax=Bauhinia variegata TaxID=167791 RepID=A0ACB9NGZ5_BAUVA|nr:hypothetical protein L6164_014096 [Bauhinia variegata]